MPADPPPPDGAAPAKSGGSPLIGLGIPLLLIATAAVVFGVFYTLNRNAPPPTPTTSSSTE